MSKNRTRKGIALGAASALVVTGFAGLPANAAGLADTSFVTLAPSAGTEYAVLSGNSKEFTLTSNEATSIVGGSLSFLVEDGDNGVEPKASETTNSTFTIESASATTTTLTVTKTNHKLVTGDVVVLAGFQIGTDATGGTDTFANDAEINDASYAITVTGDDTFTVSETFAVALPAASPAANLDAKFIKPATGTVELLRTKRSATDGSYVVISGVASSATNETLTLVTGAAETATRTIDVTAWVDANGNRVIDGNEYVSPTRTVTFIKASEVVASTSLTYPTPGDASVTATVTLTPNLNEQQDMAAGDIKIGFTRPGSTATLAANATQNDVTRVWSASQALDTGNWAGMPHIFSLKDIGTAGVSATAVTWETSSASGIANGDTVLVDGSNTGANITSAAVVSSVSSNTFVASVGSAITFAADTADTGYVQVVAKDIASVVYTATKATITTTGAHGLSIGDTVSAASITTATAGNQTIAETAVTSVPTSTSIEIAGTFTAETATANTGLLTLASYVKAVAGSYTAKAQVSSVAQGNTATNFAVATTSHDVSLASTATVNVQGASNDEVTADVTSYVRKGELSVELTATVVDVDDVAVTAGRPVVVTLGNADTAGTKVGTYTVNGTAYTTAVTLLTDANGQVKFTVGENDGAVGSVVEVTVTPENLTGAQTADLELVWSSVTYGIFDLNDSAAIASSGNNSITAGGNYTYSLAVLDQWKAAPAAGTHRVKYLTTGRTVETNYVTLTSGRGTYTVADGAVGSATNIQTVFTLEELQTDGTWAAGEQVLNDTSSNGTDSLTYTTSVVATTNVDAVLLDTDGSTAYGNAVADLSDAATAVELVAQDRRLNNLVQPTYLTAVTVSGRVANSTTNVPRAGTVVTLTGPNSILFSEGAVDALGGLTIKTDENGEFSVNLYSTTAQTATVITVTSGADSETVKVSFTGSGASFGTSIAIDAPSTVAPGTSFKVTATLRDKNGNAVLSTTGDRMLVEYSGPGIVIAAMPKDTNTLGQVSFTVLLGTNDKGTGVVTVSYDQGDDGDFTGTATGDKDVVATASILVGTAAASSDQKVNAGSFKGYVALYAKGYAGQRMSAKVGNDWVVVPVLASNFERVVEFTGAGYTVAVRIYIDRVLIDTITVTTK